MYAGIDLGGTNLKIGVLDSQNDIVYQDSMPTPSDAGPEALIARIESYLAETLYKFPGMKTIGVGVPGVVSKDGIIKIAPNLKGWININLKKQLARKFNIPVAIDNDANVAALAELEIGAGKHAADFLYVTLGTGVGGAVIHERKLFRGAWGGAGEIGHLIINMNENNPEKPSYRQGVLEEYTGRKQIAAIAESIAVRYPGSILSKTRQFDPFYISKAAESGDECAVEILSEVGFYLGIGLASAMNLLDIPLVIVGGGISLSHESLFNSALNVIRNRALPSIAQHAEIRKARFTKDAGIIGACVLGSYLDK